MTLFQDGSVWIAAGSKMDNSDIIIWYTMQQGKWFIDAQMHTFVLYKVKTAIWPQKINRPKNQHSLLATLGYTKCLRSWVYHCILPPIGCDGIIKVEDFSFCDLVMIYLWSLLPRSRTELDHYLKVQLMIALGLSAVQIRMRSHWSLWLLKSAVLIIYFQ